MVSKAWSRCIAILSSRAHDCFSPECTASGIYCCLPSVIESISRPGCPRDAECITHCFFPQGLSDGHSIWHLVPLVYIWLRITPHVMLMKFVLPHDRDEIATHCFPAIRFYKMSKSSITPRNSWHRSEVVLGRMLSDLLPRYSRESKRSYALVVCLVYVLPIFMVRNKKYSDVGILLRTHVPRSLDRNRFRIGIAVQGLFFFELISDIRIAHITCR